MCFIPIVIGNYFTERLEKSTEAYTVYTYTYNAVLKKPYSLQSSLKTHDERPIFTLLFDQKF